MSDSTPQETPASETSPSRSIAWTGWTLLAHVITGLVLVIVFVKVVPEFERLFAEFDVSLPRMSQLVLLLSNVVVCYWYLVVPLGVLVDAAILFGLSSIPDKGRWLSTLWTRFVFVAAVLLLVFIAVAMCLPLVWLIEQLS